MRWVWCACVGSEVGGRGTSEMGVRGSEVGVRGSEVGVRGTSEVGVGGVLM